MDVSSRDAHANLHAALPCPDREPVTARLALSELLFEFDSTPSIYSQANPHDVLTFLVATLGPSRSAFASVLSLSVALKHGRRWVLEELPGEGTGAGWEVVLPWGAPLTSRGPGSTPSAHPWGPGATQGVSLRRRDQGQSRSWGRRGYWPSQTEGEGLVWALDLGWGGAR